MKMKVEEERQRSELLVVTAQRQARAFTEEQHLLADRRQADQHHMEEVLAAEEMRHLDAVAQREEKAMLQVKSSVKIAMKKKRKSLLNFAQLLCSACKTPRI